MENDPKYMGEKKNVVTWKYLAGQMSLGYSWEAMLLSE